MFDYAHPDGPILTPYKPYTNFRLESPPTKARFAYTHRYIILAQFPESILALDRLVKVWYT